MTPTMIRQRGIYNTKAKETQRKQLRSNATPAEAILWTYLQRRQIDGKKFRRQASIGPYIVDFYCPECRLVVELDGDPHFLISGAESDARRTEYLLERGIRAIRFENQMVYKNLDEVLEIIRKSLE